MPGKPFCHALESYKIIFVWDSALDPNGRAYDAPPDPLVDCGEEYTLPRPYHP